VRDLRVLEVYRHIHPSLGDSSMDPECGYFVLPNGLRVIASAGMGWDHVSCSFASRTPTWDEMDEARCLFFSDDETVVQIHPPRAKHINHMTHCLHLWRPHEGEIPLPPSITIAPQEATR